MKPIKKLILKIVNRLGYKVLKKSENPNKNLRPDLFCKISYSQSGEDLIIKNIFDTVGISHPSYLDIGAHHPLYFNNTAIFYNNGSKGINIEPDPELFKHFPIERTRDINLNIGISDTSGEQDFYIINVPTLNTFSKETAEDYSKEGNYFIKEVKKIKTESINEILKQYCNDGFPNLLTIDTEGVDELILNSIDFNSTNIPIVICIETISFSETGNGVKNRKIIEFLESKNYLYFADTNINSIFVHKSYWIKDAHSS
jgi:FkbM family methyltransferase